MVKLTNTEKGALLLIAGPVALIGSSALVGGWDAVVITISAGIWVSGVVALVVGVFYVGGLFD